MSTPVRIVTSLAGAILAGAFIASCGCDREECDRLTMQIKEQAKEDPVTNYGELPPCGSSQSGGSDLPGYEGACDELRDCIDHCGGP